PDPCFEVHAWTTRFEYDLNDRLRRIIDAQGEHEVHFTRRTRPHRRREGSRRRDFLPCLRRGLESHRIDRCHGPADSLHLRWRESHPLRGPRRRELAWDTLTNVPGALLEETAFPPFGEPRHGFQPRGHHDPYQCSQKERDAETGMHDLDARYLSGVMSRFISPDPKFAHPDQLPPEDFT